MALSVNQVQRMDVKVSDIENVLTAASGDTQLNPPTDLAKNLNELWEGQVTEVVISQPEEIRETYRFNPFEEEITTGYRDPDWSFTSRAWSPLMLDLNKRKATFVFSPMRNTGRGVASTYAETTTFNITAEVTVSPPSVDSSRPSSGNTCQVTLHPLTYHFNNAAGTELLRRDIAGKIFIEHGVDKLRGLRSGV